MAAEQSQTSVPDTQPYPDALRLSYVPETQSDPLLETQKTKLVALKAEFNAAKDNPEKLKALLKKLFPDKHDYAEAMEAANGDLFDAIDSYIDVCEQDIEAEVEANDNKKRKREMHTANQDLASYCTHCGKKCKPRFTSHARSTYGDDKFYCSFACLQNEPVDFDGSDHEGGFEQREEDAAEERREAAWRAAFSRAATASSS